MRILYKQGYAIYVFDGIDPDRCYMKGTAYWDQKADFMKVEYTMGSGTVRSNDTSLIQRAEISKKAIVGGSKPLKFDGLIIAWRKIPEEFQNEILEWSEYVDPVGRLRQHWVFWELRPWTS